MYFATGLCQSQLTLLSIFTTMLSLIFIKLDLHKPILLFYSLRIHACSREPNSFCPLFSKIQSQLFFQTPFYMGLCPSFLLFTTISTDYILIGHLSLNKNHYCCCRCFCGSAKIRFRHHHPWPCSCPFCW